MNEYHSEMEQTEQNKKHSGMKPFFIFVGGFAAVLIILKILMNMLG